MTESCGMTSRKALDPPVRAGVAHHALVLPPRALEGDRVLDDVHLIRALAIAVPDEEAEAFALVDLHGGDEEAPEGVL